jgi:hypothetical protein
MNRENAQGVLPQSVSTSLLVLIVHRGYASVLNQRQHQKKGPSDHIQVMHILVPALATSRHLRKHHEKTLKIPTPYS